MESRHRVVVYSLDDSSHWVEIGQGYCEYESDGNDSGRILVHSEDDGNTFYSCAVQHDVVYRLEQDTIIAWSDPNGTDYALSFEDSLGCERYWSIIHNVQSSALASIDSDPSSSTAEPESPSKSFVELPPVELNTLSEIDTVIANSSYSWYSKTQLIKSILSNGYLGKLFDLFEIAEDLESFEELYKLFHIFKKLVLMHNPDLIETLLKDEYISKFIGIFEYDPTSPKSKSNYREFLKEKVMFREIIPIKNEEVKERIHIIFRAQYIRDTVLSKVLNDETYFLLNNIIRNNQQLIMDKIENDSEFAEALCSLIVSNTDEQVKRSILSFLKELFTMMKSLSRDNSLLKVFKFDSLLDFLDIMFASQEDIDILVLISDLYLSIISSLVVEMREYILKSSKKQGSLMKILNNVVEKFKTTKDYGIRSLCAQIIRLLLNSNPTDIRNDEFLNLFYEQTAKYLLSPLNEIKLHCNKSTGEIVFEPEKSDLYYHILGLLGGFTSQHTYRIKYVILSGTILENIILMTRCREKYLVLGAIRYVRLIFGMMDDFYNRYIIKINLFEKIIHILEEYAYKENMIASTLLEMFEFIRIKNLKSLIEHIMTLYGDKIDRLGSDIDLLQKFKLRYEQNNDKNFISIIAPKDPLATPLHLKQTKPSEQNDVIHNLKKEIIEGSVFVRKTSTTKPEMSNYQARQGWGAGLDEDEEAYFSSSNEEDENHPDDSHSRPLDMDYDDNKQEEFQPCDVDISDHPETDAYAKQQDDIDIQDEINDAEKNSPPPSLNSPFIDFVKASTLYSDNMNDLPNKVPCQKDNNEKSCTESIEDIDDHDGLMDTNLMIKVYNSKLSDVKPVEINEERPTKRFKT